MSDKHRKRRSTLLSVRKMLIKATTKYHCPSTRKAKMKENWQDKCWQEYRLTETLKYWLPVCVFNRSVVSNSLRPHGLQPAKLLCPWDSPGKNTGVGCHFLLQGSSWPRDQTHVPFLGRRILHHWANREAQLISCCCSVAQSCLTLCDPLDCSMPGLPVLHHLPELAQTHVHCTGDASHLILCGPLLLLPSVFFNEWALRIRWPKDWNFSFSISTSNEYSGLISFRIDWFDLLAVQGTLKSLL